MTTTPTHIESYDAIPRDLDVNDHSRTRGSMTTVERTAAERIVNLGNGMTAVTYVDTVAPPADPEA